MTRNLARLNLARRNLSARRRAMCPRVITPSSTYSTSSHWTVRRRGLTLALTPLASALALVAALLAALASTPEGWVTRNSPSLRRPLSPELGRVWPLPLTFGERAAFLATIDRVL